MNYKGYIKLFISFFRIGLFTFGGGYAMLPMLQKEIVDKNKWAEDEELVDYFAVGQSAPGIIAVNTATFIGYKVGKIKGALVATAGIAMPSLIIITILAAFLNEYSDNIYISKALLGIRGAVVALIAVAVIRILSKAKKTYDFVVLLILGFGLLVFLNLSPIYIVFGSIVLGVLYTFTRKYIESRKGKKG